MDNACLGSSIGPVVSDQCALSESSFHDEEPATPRRHISCIIAQEACSSMPEGVEKETAQACCSTGSEEEEGPASSPVGPMEKVAFVQGQPLRGLTEEMRYSLDEVLRRLEFHEVKIQEAVQRLDSLEAFQLDGSRGRMSPACVAPQGHTPKAVSSADNLDDSTARLRILHRASQALGHEAQAVMQSLGSDQAKAVMLPTSASSLSASSVGGSKVDKHEATVATFCGRGGPAWKAVLRAELRAEVQARSAALEARLAAVEAAFQTGLKSADARLSSAAIALAGTGAELRSLVPRVNRLEAAAEDTLQQLAITDVFPRMAAEAEPAPEGSPTAASAAAAALAVATAAVPSATGPPIAATRMQHPIARSGSIDNTSEANTRYFSQACASARSAEASRAFSVPPYRTPQNVSAPAYRKVPVYSWSHVAPSQNWNAHSESSFSVPTEIPEEAVMEEAPQVPVLPYWSRAAASRTDAAAQRRSGRSLPLSLPVGSGSGRELKHAEAASLPGQRVPPTLAAAQEATSKVVRKMMDSMGGLEACGQASSQLSALMEAAWAPPTAPPTNSNACRRRFMDPQQGQSQQQPWLRH